MRRLSVRLVTLVALLLLALPVAASAESVEAADGTSPDVEVLAVDDEPVGPDPRPRTDEDNSARTLSGYEDPDVPFTWGAAWILTFAGLAGLILLVGLYQLLVRGPEQRAKS